MEKKDIDSVILKVISAQASEKEKEEVELWLKEAKENREYYQNLLNYWKHKPQFGYEAIEESTWGKIVEKSDLSRDPVKKGKVRLLGATKFISASAAAVILLLATYISIQFDLFTFQEKQEIVEQRTEKLPERITPKGQKLTFTLTDGTVVKMNSESKLSVISALNSNKREVHLTGEAFFDVAEDKKRPFIIHSEGIQTIVHGTSFNVRSYPSDNMVSVALVTGKVELKEEGKKESVFLEPNEVGTFKKGDKDFDKKPLESEMLAWKDGIIIFKNSSFEEVQETLERWYGLPFELKRKVDLAQGFTGEYNNQTLEEVLEGISFSGKFDFDIRSEKVIIY